MNRLLVYALILMMCVIGGSACSSDEQPTKVVLEGAGASVKPAVTAEKATVRIAVGGMITPKEAIVYYHDLLRYIGEEIGEKVAYVGREDYAAINEMLKLGDLDAAFVCSGPYVDGKREFGLELLVAPQAYGETVYYSYIIVARESPYRSLDELQGKRFAFTDPLSNTGKLVPTYMLARMGETPETFFQEVIFTKSHDKSIKAVALGIVDGAAVDSLVWEYLNASNPEFTAQTRIVKKSLPFAIPPVAVPGDLEPALKAKLQQVFLNAHRNPRGREILQKMKIDRFVLIEDKAYDSVRAMQDWLAKQSGGE